MAVLSESAARSVFPTENPIGQAIQYGPGNFEIVGVAADVKTTGLETIHRVRTMAHIVDTAVAPRRLQKLRYKERLDWRLQRGLY